MVSPSPPVLSLKQKLYRTHDRGLNCSPLNLKLSFKRTVVAATHVKKSMLQQRAMVWQEAIDQTGMLPIPSQGETDCEERRLRELVMGDSSFLP